MKTSTKKIAFPFRIGVEPMKRLLIADFQNDSSCVSIQPQLFDEYN